MLLSAGAHCQECAWYGASSYSAVVRRWDSCDTSPLCCRPSWSEFVALLQNVGRLKRDLETTAGLSLGEIGGAAGLGAIVAVAVCGGCGVPSV